MGRGLTVPGRSRCDFPTAPQRRPAPSSDAGRPAGVMRAELPRSGTFTGVATRPQSLSDYLDRLVAKEKKEYATALAGHVFTPGSRCVPAPSPPWAADVFAKVLRYSAVATCCGAPAPPPALPVTSPPARNRRTATRQPVAPARTPRNVPPPPATRAAGRTGGAPAGELEAGRAQKPAAAAPPPAVAARVERVGAHRSAAPLDRPRGADRPAARRLLDAPAQDATGGAGAPPMRADLLVGRTVKAVPPPTPETLERLALLTDHLSRVAALAGTKLVTDVLAHDVLAERDTLLAGLPGHSDALGEGPLLRVTQPDPAAPAPAPPTLPEGWCVAGDVNATGAHLELAPGPDESAAEAAATFEQWRADLWSPWAAHEQQRSASRRLFDALFDAQRRLERDGEALEAVWGTTVIQAETVPPIRYPLATVRVSLRLDTATEPATIVVESVGDPQLERERLGALGPQEQQHLSDLMRDTFANDIRNIAGELEQTGEALMRAREVPVRSWHGSAIGSDAEEGLTRTWVLFLRAPRVNYAAYFTQAGKQLRALPPGTELPLALARLAGDQHDAPARTPSTPLLPLATNAQQQAVAERIDSGAPAVTVQGPPGTGKTHTIANLLSHFLAQGKRVLVTSHKEPALRVLRDKLPTDLRALCVSATDTTRGNTELEASILGLLDRAVPLDRSAAHARITELEGRLADQRAAATRLRADLVASAAADQEVLNVAGQQRNATELLRWFDENGTDARRIPDIIPSGTDLPLNMATFTALLATLRSATPEDFHDVDAGLPTCALPPGSAVVHLAAEVADLQAQQRALNVAIRSWTGPAEAPPPAAHFEPEPEMPVFVPEDFVAPTPPEPTPPTPPAATAPTDGPVTHELRSIVEDLARTVPLLPGPDLGRRLFTDVTYAQHISSTAQAAATALSAASAQHDPNAHLGLGSFLAGAAADLLAEAAQVHADARRRVRLPRHLTQALRGLQLNGAPVEANDRPMVLAALDEARFLRALTHIHHDLTATLPEVLDQLPSTGTTPEWAHALERHVRSLAATAHLLGHTLPRLLERTAALGVPAHYTTTSVPALEQLLPAVREVEYLVGWRREDEARVARNTLLQQTYDRDLDHAQARHTAATDRARAAHAGRHAQTLDAWRARTTVARLAHEEALRRHNAVAAHAVAVARDAEVVPLEAQLRGVEQQLPRLAGELDALQGELRTFRSSSLPGRLLEALEASDSGRWDHLRGRAAHLQQRQGAFAGAVQALDQLAAHAPLWVQELRESCGAAGVSGAPEQLTTMWAGAQIRGHVQRLRALGEPGPLRTELARVSAQVLATTTELVSERAWLAAAQRLTPADKTSLTEWSQHMGRIGKGAGKSAPRHAAAARVAMGKCSAAVPAWIMPIDRVVQTFQPLDGPLFDVVIVDESSQSNVLATAAFFVGSQIIVVGDDKQVSPQAVVSEERVSDLLRELPEGLPMRGLYDLRTSLYDLAQALFDDVIRLQDHFRCRPEIITFCSTRSYAGNLAALRAPAASSDLIPLRTVHVPGGAVDAHGTAVVNRGEASAIIDFLRASFAAPAYQGKSFGVVSLLGDAQAQLIDEMARIAFGTAVSTFKLKVGTAPQFQGDERDVVCLSLVAATQTVEGGRRSIGAALDLEQRVNVAVSRAADQLVVFHSAGSEDFPGRDDPRAALLRYIDSDASLSSAPAGVAQTLARCDPNSPFEVEVCRWLLEQGFRVHPQYPVGGYRLDLVVSDGATRLAVECDGERWHGPERWEADLARQMALEAIGWVFHRIRGRDFYGSRERAYHHLGSALAAAGIRPYGRGHEAASP